MHVGQFRHWLVTTLGYWAKYPPVLWLCTDQRPTLHTYYCRQEPFQYATGTTPMCAKQTPQAATKPKTEAASIGLATFAPNSKHGIWK